VPFNPVVSIDDLDRAAIEARFELNFSEESGSTAAVTTSRETMTFSFVQ
jgi:hypothetical protein